MSAGATLVVDDLSHRYRSVRALDAVSLTLDYGVTALVGVNGAGKSTLLSAIAGARRPSSGRIVIGGQDPYGRGRRAALRSVALMPQAMTLPRNMTAREVVEYVAWMRGLPPRRARASASQALDDVRLGKRAQSKIGQLSGGMLRRVALAQAIASDAQVILLDEPSTGLDPAQRRVMVELVSGLDRTVLMSSHIMEDVVDCAERALVLHEGRLLFDGSVDQLRAQAPTGTDPARTAEMGFLSLIAAGHQADM